MISDIKVNDYTTEKMLKSGYIFETLIFNIQLICLPSNFQYKKWTSARVRDHPELVRSKSYRSTWQV